MITAQDNGVDKFISLAGAGQEIDDVVIKQIEAQAPDLKDNARQAFDDLRVNGVAQNYSPLLVSIFRPSLQSFMFSWMQYNPQTLVSEAEKLKEAKPDAQLVIFKNMNHIFKDIKGDMIENQKSYNDETIPIMPELIKVISTFILK